jgi:hypothetical protein
LSLLCSVNAEHTCRIKACEVQLSSSSTAPLLKDRTNSVTCRPRCWVCLLACTLSGLATVVGVAVYNTNVWRCDTACALSDLSHVSLSSVPDTLVLVLGLMYITWIINKLYVTGRFFRQLHSTSLRSVCCGCPSAVQRSLLCR